ncbi:MAG: dicarboxylate/amino acid:cation symporter [Bacteroidetes bacterium]|nr:dicarboxylate/amino acid:cation symporter [Rhodothermia bacterium]MCS7156038.1 dicarboxylate/amino acid:cation symporter [Bacteroidota bacterium]MCX7907726.1 dicarboxylate/amino acid:cation symporter [Bacteroidota bacterium]MDW8137855.1 dicarboxylate/amino acid:cation symporter [Bacteroidota bacterium]MDW8286294.1 dicarboxylate/amino acid:cation symporter [Bacteroidota bacterium]
MWYRQLHWQIILGLTLGVLFGLLTSAFGWAGFAKDWIKPWGTIFVNLLKLVAVPLVLASLITGVASLSDLTKLSRIGGKTIGLYIGTTVLAITLGLLLVNVLRPGQGLPAEMRQELMKSYAANVEQSAQRAQEVQQTSPLQPIVDIVPENLLRAASDNRNMLQIVFVALLLGIGLIGIERSKAEPVRAFFAGLNEVIIRLVELIMRMAPLGVFALITGVIADLAGDNPSRALELLRALAWYGLTVLVGLLLHTFGTYALLVRALTPIRVGYFYKAFRPAQLVAFSTSSSAATLPVTMERCERGLGVSKEISSFTLPLGATINMDGTALYQSVAAVFIAQVLGLNLGLQDQLMIVLTATLASIGAAAVPGAGVIMLVIILQAIHVPVEGIALILGIDRILDMCRTVTNVTGDATVTCVVAHSEGKLQPVVREEAVSTS